MSEKKPDEKLVRAINPFGLRMLPELRALLEDAARTSGRSLNQEIVDRLMQSLLLGFRELPPDIVDRMLRAPFASRRTAEALIWAGIMKVLHEHFPDELPTRRSIAALNDLFYEGLDRIQYDAPKEEQPRLRGELIEELRRTASKLGVEWAPPDPLEAPF